jgi:phosphatidylinositol 3-kinase
MRFDSACAAGFLVIAYIFGIGDRHEDNMLLDPNWRVFFNDFGFLFGKSVHLFPPFLDLII